MKKRQWGWYMLISTGAVIIIVMVIILSNGLKIKEDIDRLQTEEYDTLFLSMYPVDNYEEEDFMYYRGMDCVKTEYSISNGKLMRWYMKTAREAGNSINRVYLGINPEHTSKEDIVLMIQENPETIFELTLAYPQMEYWTKKSVESFDKIMQNYQEFAEWIIQLENANLYYFGCEEWLIANPSNYEEVFLTNTEVSEFLMCNTDESHPYEITKENVQVKFEKMRTLVEQYRTTPNVYPEGEEVEIVFIGDSIIGNYTDSLSVPEVVRGLTGATVYNCGYGGCSAAKRDDKEGCFPEVVEALIKGETSGLPEDKPVYNGVEQFEIREVSASDKQLVFVINYGLNDYYDGLPIVTEETYDIYSFTGALRQGIRKLKEAYPQAQILLMTPNFTAQYNWGKDKTSEQGGTLEQYAEAICLLAEELEVDILDNFNELPICEENWQVYIPDSTHLNEKGRFLLGSRIAQKIKVQE